MYLECVPKMKKYGNVFFLKARRAFMYVCFNYEDLKRLGK